MKYHYLLICASLFLLCVNSFSQSVFNQLYEFDEFIEEPGEINSSAYNVIPLEDGKQMIAGSMRFNPEWDPWLRQDSIFNMTLDRYGRIEDLKLLSFNHNSRLVFRDCKLYNGDYLNLFYSHNDDYDYNLFYKDKFIHLERNTENTPTPYGMEIRDDILYMFGSVRSSETNISQAYIATYNLKELENNEDTLKYLNYNIINSELYSRIEGIDISDNGYIIMHAFSSTHMLISSSGFYAMDIYLLNSDLSLNWHKQFMDINLHGITDIVISKQENNVFYISGVRMLVGFVAKFDFEGYLMWYKELPIIENQDLSGFTSMVEDDAGNIYAAGIATTTDSTFYGVVHDSLLSYTSNDLFGLFTKFNKNGDLQWQKLYEKQTMYHASSYPAYIRDLQKTRNGGFIICGRSGNIPDLKPWIIKTDSLGNEVLPLSVFAEQEHFDIEPGETAFLNPIPYGGTGIVGYVNSNWSGNTEFVKSATEFGVDFSTSIVGEYSLTFFIADTLNNVTSKTFTINVSKNITSNSQLLNNKYWSVYPLPANDIIHFENKNIDVTNLVIEFYDTQGRLVDKTNNNYITVSEWKTGVYSYSIKDDNTVIKQGKVLVQN